MRSDHGMSASRGKGESKATEKRDFVDQVREGILVPGGDKAWSHQVGNEKHRDQV